MVGVEADQLFSGCDGMAAVEPGDCLLGCRDLQLVQPRGFGKGDFRNLEGGLFGLDVKLQLFARGEVGGCL